MLWFPFAHKISKSAILHQLLYCRFSNIFGSILFPVRMVHTYVKPSNNNNNMQKRSKVYLAWEKGERSIPLTEFLDLPPNQVKFLSSLCIAQSYPPPPVLHVAWSRWRVETECGSMYFIKLICLCSVVCFIISIILNQEKVTFLATVSFKVPVTGLCSFCAVFQSQGRTILSHRTSSFVQLILSLCQLCTSPCAKLAV